MVDEFLEKYKNKLKYAKNDKEVDAILNKLYSDGYEDGVNDDQN